MVDGKDLLKEFDYCLSNGDAIKMTLVLESLPKVSPAIVSEVTRALEQSGASFLIASIVDLQKKYRQAYESVTELGTVLTGLLSRHHDEIVPFIEDDAVFDKLPALEAARRLQYKGAVGSIEKLLLAKDTGKFAHKAIEVLAEFGMPSSVKALSGFLYSSNRSLIGAAIRALGNIATPSAIERLAECTGSDVARDILVVREFARLQLPPAMEKLVNFLCSHHTQLRNYAKEKLAATGVKALPYLINVLRSGDADWTVQALNLLGEIGDDSAGTPVRKLLQSGPESANVRFAAYEALEHIKITAGGYTLTEGLLDSDEQVAFAAARAINANLTETMVNGLKALIANDEENRDRYLKILLNAEAEEVVKALAGDVDIVDSLAAVLNYSVRDDIHKYFSGLAGGWPRSALSGKLRKRIYIKRRGAGEIWVVDDSKTVLALYKEALGDCECTLRLFERALPVMNIITHEKPVMLFVDLNMPEMNGLELVDKIRKIYPAGELPIVLVTTQTDVSADNDFKYENINDVVEKPFSSDGIRKLVEKYRV